MVYNGKCLCGETTVKVDIEAQDKQIACHCIDCQLTSGTSNSSNIREPPAMARSSKLWFFG